LRPHLERGGYHVDCFDACLDGAPIVTSRPPLYDGAREPPMACSRTGTPKEQASFAPGPIYGLAGWTYEVTCAARTLRPRSAPLSKIPTPVLRAGSGDLTARAGVAETTIYRRWPNVSAIVTDAFLAEVTRTAPIQERTTVRESFAASMRMLARAYRGRQGKILQPLLGRAQLDEKLREAVRKALGGAPAAVRPRDQSGAGSSEANSVPGSIQT
jgi:hypothetical protein